MSNEQLRLNWKSTSGCTHISYTFNGSCVDVPTDMADSAPCGPAARICVECKQAMIDNFDKKFKVTSNDSTRQENHNTIEKAYSSRPQLTRQLNINEYLLTDYLPDLAGLLQSAQNGCDFCGFLRTLILLDETRDRLRSEYKTDIASLGSSEVRISVIYEWEQRDVNDHSVNNYLVVKVDFGSNIRCDYWHALNAVEGHDELAKRLGLVRSLNQSYSDTETVQWLRSCIGTCEKHEHSAPKSDYLPDRLLDITNGKARLVPRDSVNRESSGLFPDYAALSYCWGTFEDAQVQLKTTHSSLAQRQAGIQREDLLMVPALNDAIRMTRELGISYLWIDSLCILQDDISDWERNSSSMDKVYGSAKVTLVAAASRSCREGFLKVKGQQLLLSVRSTTQPIIRGLIQVQFKFCFTGLVGTPHDSYADFHNTPLSRRGWTVQERLLSARQIVFGPCNVHFTCPHWRQSRGARLKGITDFAMSDIRSEETSVLYSTWSKIVSEFMYITAESFTNPSDLLPALSGLAHCFNRRFQDEYCAGHWKKQLLTSLMWTRVNFSTISKMTHLQTCRSPIPYLLPSWSYLSKGYLDYYHITHNEASTWNGLPSHVSDVPEVEYIEWERCLLRNDPMGALKSAKLNIRTRTMNLSVLKTLAVRHTQSRWSHEGPSGGLEQKWVIVPDYRVGSSFLNLHLDYDCTKSNVVLDTLGWKLVLMGSCSMRYPDSKPQHRILFQSYEAYRYPYGLVVAKLWEEKEDWYRIGTFTPREYGDFTLHNLIEHSEVESITIF